MTVDDVRRRYALWMLVYPPAWRREHGEALLGTFLDAADARGGTGPTGREAAGILRHGLVWRLRLLAPSEPTRHLASMLALATGTALALTSFLLGEWQPGIAARGWRVEPGHVGPFATLGVLLYAVWLAALLAALAGMASAVRRLLVAALLLAVGLGGTLFLLAPLNPFGMSVPAPNWSGILGFRRPPGWVLVSMAGLSGLALLGRLRLSPVERVMTLLGGLVGGGVLCWSVLGVVGSSWTADPSFTFYRRDGSFQVVDLVGYQTMPVILLVAALAWPRRRTWLPAVLLWTVAFLPYASPPVTVPRSVEIWWNRFSYETAYPPAFLDSLVAWGSVLLLALAVWHRWRRGRPESAGSADPAAASSA
jgi:hypothetical protein